MTTANQATESRDRAIQLARRITRTRHAAHADRGFTLIELLVVVVIIGILIAIAIPLYLNYQKSSNDKAAQSDVRHAISLLETCNSDNGSYPTAAFTATSGAAAGTCSSKINISSGTSMKYYPKASGDGASYSLIATSSNGNVTGATNGFYCYAQAAGGSVAKKTAATTPAVYSATC